MALKGDLASVDLAQVFQMLALNKKVGLLSIHSPRLWKVLYFDPRGVTLYYNEHGLLERVVASLVRIGRLDNDSLGESRNHAAQMGTGLTDTLLAAGYVNDEDLESQTRCELEEEIYDLFFCKDARFEFFEGLHSLEGRPGVVDERFFFNTDSVIMEAARRIDEWSYISERISSPLEVFRVTDAPIDPEEIRGESQGVLDVVDGKRNVARITEVSGIANFLVFKSLSQLLDSGYVEPLPQEEMLDAGNACMSEGRLPEAINLYEKAVAFGIGVPEVHTLAAEAYQAAQEFERAVGHLKTEAEHRIAAGDVKGAVPKLRQAVQLLPTDLAARERLVELTVGNNDVVVDGLDPLAEGKHLVDLYVSVGDLKRVRSLLERLLRLQPDDLDLKKVLVNVHSKAGDQKRVIELYEAIAQDLVRSNRPLEAIGYLQKILMVDRSRADISEKVRALYEFDERTRTRRRMLAMLGVVLCVLAALGVVYWFYDRHAAETFERIDVAKMIEQDEFAKAAGIYQSFINDFPLTLSVQRAEEELARVESLRKKHDAKVAGEKAAHARELARIRGEYKAQWAKHREMFLAGDSDASLRCIENVRTLVAEAGENDDKAWSLEEQVEKSYTRLKDYLAKAESLAKDGKELLARGDWQKAREVLVQLVKDYDVTKSAKQARIPVLVVTRPLGARIAQNGVPLTHDVDGVQQPLHTPAVLLCSASVDESFSVDLEGFESQTFGVKAKEQASIDMVLKVVAERTIRFPAPAMTGAGISGDLIIVGLRDGRLGIAHRSTGKVGREVSLGGLRAADTMPVTSGGLAFFISNEATIECVVLEQGTLAAGWPVKLSNGAATDLAVRDGRIVVIDRSNKVLCFDQANGRAMWAVQLDAPPSGPPTIERRVVRVGTVDGQIRLLDGSTGDNVAAWRAPAGLTTRVLSADGTMFFGCSDGTVRAVEENSGRVLWTQALGRNPVDGDLAVASTGVLAHADHQVRLLSRTTGEIRATSPFEGELQRGMLVAGDRVFLTLRLPREKGKAVHDLLRAVSVENLSPLWEYVDVGMFLGQPATDGTALLITDSNGEVVLFR